MDAYSKQFETRLDRLREAIKSGSHSVIDEILGDEKFKTTLKWKDSHSGESRAKLVNIAVCNDDAATLNLLLDRGVTVNLDERRSKVIPPLLYAVIHGRARIAEILATRARQYVNQRTAGADYYKLDNGDTALHAASRYGYEQLAVLLVKNGAKIDALNSKGETALQLTVTSKIGDEPRRAMARCLLDHGARIDIGREPVLLFAIAQMDLEMARLIIDQRKDALETKDSLGRGALHYVMMVCPTNIEFATMLVRKGMNVNQPNMAGERPLLIAIETDNAVMTRFLLEHCAVDLDAATPAGITPLHIACGKGNRGLVRMLLKYGANPNATLSSAKTPLEIACGKGCEDMVWMLLKSGAEIKMAPWQGHDIFYTQVYYSNVYKSSIRCMMIKHAVLAEKHLMCERFYEAFRNDLYFLNCKVEIRRLKWLEFYRDLTFFKILKARVDELARMMRNEKVREAFEAGYPEEVFPLYARHLNERFEEVKLMVKVRNSAEEILSAIFLTILPCDVTRKILDYVSHTDMEILAGFA